MYGCVVHVAVAVFIDSTFCIWYNTTYRIRYNINTI